MNIKHTLQSGRSMVEMLGTLAVMGVLSIGGIMGYSYGMDRYKVNATINDINLRMMDLITQTINHPNSAITLSNEWGNKGTIYPMVISEVIYDDGISEYALEVNDVPKQVCEMVFNNLISSYSIDIGENHYDNIIGISDNVCDEENTMLFYPQKCSGKDENGNCIVCADGLEWFDSAGECLLSNGCPETHPILGEYCSHTVCKSCPSPAYYQDSQCLCDGIIDFSTGNNTGKDFVICNPCVSPAYAQNGECVCPYGYIKSSDTKCSACVSPAYFENEQCNCPAGYIKSSDTSCFKCPDDSTPNSTGTECICSNGIKLIAGTCSNPVLGGVIGGIGGIGPVIIGGCGGIVPEGYKYPGCIYPAEK